jgi:mono/diheme cytochrome c family protein
MRKVEFAWLLPVCMVLILAAIGAVVYRSLDWLQTPPTPLEVAQNLEFNCGIGDPVRRPVQLDPSAANYKSIVSGETLFKGNCAQCHAVDDVVIGPALAGITERRPLSWIIPWVKNSSKVVASGDEYAMKIFTQYQKQQMPSFQLSDAEIKDIITYIETQRAMVSGNQSVAVTL